MTNDELQAIRHAARAAAAQLCAKFRVPRHDLEQQALADIIENMPKYDPARGDLRAWAYSIARRTAYTTAVRERAIVSGSRSRLSRLNTTTRVDLDTAQDLPAKETADTYDVEELHQRLHQRLQVLLAEKYKTVVPLLAGAIDPQEFADFAGIPVYCAYNSTAYYTRKLRKDKELRKLWNTYQSVNTCKF